MVSRTVEEYIFSKHSLRTSSACCVAMCSSYSLKYLSSNDREGVSSPNIDDVPVAGAGFPKIKSKGFRNTDKKIDCGLIDLYRIVASIVVPNVYNSALGSVCFSGVAAAALLYELIA